MKLFMFAAALQANSLNKKLINLIAIIAKEQNLEVDRADFKEFEVPLYNPDIQNKQGFPAAVTQFIARMNKADAIILSVPEYNYSIPGTLKNLIDWVSRVKPMPWKNERILLCSASPSLVGGNRGLWATRIPLEACGAIVYPEMFSLAAAHEAFNEQGQLKDQLLQQRLLESIKQYVGFVEKLIGP
jgi:chromate reductase, NAD(P)H dehydrogenase (quinone)